MMPNHDNWDSDNDNRTEPQLGLSQVRACLAEGVPPGHSDDDGARRQWWAALATLQEDFLLGNPDQQGIWLAAPLPALFEPRVLERLEGWVWAPEQLEGLLTPRAPLLPGLEARPQASNATFQQLALEENDGTDPLLIVITAEVQVALCLDGTATARRLVVRFDPSVLSQALSLVHARLTATDPASAERLRTSLQTLGSLNSQPDLGLRFWPRLAERLSSMAPSVTLQTLASPPDQQTLTELSSELALLEALTHEVRTPLATIRTLIRSLLRRRDLSELVRQRLDLIDGECSEQIDRFGLIFLAAELQRQPPGTESDANPSSQLARTDLSQLLLQLKDLWERQLSRRQVKLELVIQSGLPEVLSDPARLETMLGGLMDRYSRGLPAGSTVRLTLQPAGSRLKLQLSSAAENATDPLATEDDNRRAVGPVLSWNPKTGNLQLSRQATEQLLRRLGGRLTGPSRSGLTVFFPVY